MIHEFLSSLKSVMIIKQNLVTPENNRKLKTVIKNAYYVYAYVFEFSTSLRLVTLHGSVIVCKMSSSSFDYNGTYS